MKSICLNNNSFEVYFSKSHLVNLRNNNTLGAIPLRNGMGRKIGKFIEINYRNNLFSKVFPFFSTNVSLNPKKGFDNSDFLEIYLTESVLKQLEEKKYYHTPKNEGLITLRFEQ